ncbi:MAG: thiamine-phosphate kinase [Gammaproteobacteria bacterium]|nr:thiamine-phosphate kinase [Gammaproteobacteria bacterium]
MALEFDLIDTFFKPLCFGLSELEVGIGDDGAVISAPANHQLVVVTDTLVAGVHFPVEATAADIAWKAVAVNLSDLAAMGAKPGFYSLALTLPENNQEWLKDFAAGLKAVSERFKMPLVGGDTTKGPLTITVTAQGWVPKGQAILRSGAQLKDLICVTETIGDGALGLKVALNQLAIDPGFELDKKMMLSALNRPIPQLDIAPGLVGLVNSAIDISDGLLADLGHVLSRSTEKAEGVVLGAEIALPHLPLSESVKQYVHATGDWALPLSGGDDYELCMTVSAENLPVLERYFSTTGVRLSVIGKITNSGKVVCVDEQGHAVDRLNMHKSGYSHF